MTPASGRGRARPRPWRWLALLLVAVAGSAACAELDFVFVDGFPAIDGLPEAPIDLHDARTGLVAEKTVYMATLGGAHRLLTLVVRTRCGAWASEPAWNVTAMVAQQILPGAVASARDADARNRFFAVYALDESGRIRLYHDLSVIELTELTRRTLPSCPAL